jgi:hypothetical protein
MPEVFSDWKLKLIDDMSPANLFLVDVFMPIDGRHYAKQFRPWYDDERHLLGEKLNHQPDAGEMLSDFISTHNPQRFRLWYLMNFPGKMVMRNDLGKCSLDQTIVFLETLSGMNDGPNYVTNFLGDYSI